MWIELNWLKMGSSYRSYKYGSEPSVPRKVGEFDQQIEISFSIRSPLNSYKSSNI
jgi:hypothetical protein